ncbi:MAG: hypothetical protein ACYS8Z_09810 [Planctomycetota bacterium]
MWQANISDREWKMLNAPLLAGMTFSPSTSSLDLHHFEMPCKNCHTPADNTSATAETEENIRALKRDISSLCGSAGCHEFDPAVNHSVGMVVSRDIAGGKPLDSQSRMTCLTCHHKEEPANAPGNLVLDDYMGGKLYVPRGTELCSSCHTRMGGGMKEQSHWQFSRKAHLGNISSASSMSSEDEPSVGIPGDVDAESKTCVGCHNDVSITVPREHETTVQRRARRSRMTDHPIGMNYSRSSAKKAGRLRPLNGRMSDVRLFNGKVGCGSCHSLYLKAKGHILKSSQGPSVCSACHIR